MAQISINLPGGISITGDETQLAQFLEKQGIKLDDGTYYKSESKGLIKITDMNTEHLKNAILKMYREWVDDLRKINEPKKLVSTMLEGLTDTTWKAMVKELYNREIV